MSRSPSLSRSPSTTGRSIRRAASDVLGPARAAALVICAGLWSTAALAEPTLDKDADAERLFREGQKLLEERRFGEACPKFEAAYKKDQQLGTLLNLAYCHKEQGAIWQSWLEFKEAELKAVELKRNDRREFARHRMAELEKLLVRAVVDVSKRVELSEVLVEDRRIPEAEKGHTFAVEPGQRKFTFRAKGKKQAVTLVKMVKSERPQRISVPEMEDEVSEAAAEEPTAAPAEEVSEPPSEPPAQRSSGGIDQRTVGLIVGGAGIAGLVVGTITGLMTFANECSGTRANPPCTREEQSRGVTTSTIANVSFGVGALGLIGGVVLYLTAPSERASAAFGTVGPRAAHRVRALPEIGPGWAGVRGVF